MLGGHLYLLITLVLGSHSLGRPETKKFPEEEVVAKYNEVARSILPAAKKAHDVIREDLSKINFWDGIIPTVFFSSFVAHISGIAVDLENMDLLDISLMFWRVKSLGSYFVLFSLPHMYPESFGAGSEHLSCSLEDVNRTLSRMRELRPENRGQLAVDLENYRIQLRLALRCVLTKGHKYNEAAEVEFLLQQLFDLYDDMLQFKLPAPPSVPDPSSLAHYDRGLVEFRGRLAGLAGRTSAASREAIANKNQVIYEGVAFGAVGIFASGMAIIKSEESVQERKRKHESNVTEWDRARGIIAKGLKLAAAILEGIAYIALLGVEYESPSVIDCGAEDMEQALEEFPLLARPGDILSTTGSLRTSKRMVDDLSRALRRNLNCILHKAESFELFTTIDSYLILLAKRIASS